MAEAFSPGVLSSDKATRYAELRLEVASVLEGEPDRTAQMAAAQ